MKLFPFVFTTSSTMKFSTVFTALVVIVPLFSGEALAAAQGNKGFGKGSKGVPPPPAKNNNKNNTATNNSTASNNSAASNSSAANNNAASNNNGGDNNPQTSFSALCPIYCRELLLLVHSQLLILVSSIQVPS